MTNVSIVQGDITRMVVDAIVNAANTVLLSGGGVCGAIHRAAGPELEEECLKLGGCETGNAKITAGYNLPARYVIHAVGPVWYGGGHNEPQLLYNAYYNSLKVAEEHNVKTIAFPNISTGIFGFPKQQAAQIALRAVNDFCKDNSGALDEIVFVCFDDENYSLYRSTITQ